MAFAATGHVFSDQARQRLDTKKSRQRVKSRYRILKASLTGTTKNIDLTDFFFKNVTVYEVSYQWLWRLSA
jgi:hypothetical protein